MKISVLIQKSVFINTKKSVAVLFNFGSLVRVGVILFVTILKEIFLLIDRELLP